MDGGDGFANSQRNSMNNAIKTSAQGKRKELWDIISSTSLINCSKSFIENIVQDKILTDRDSKENSLFRDA